MDTLVSPSIAGGQAGKKSLALCGKVNIGPDGPDGIHNPLPKLGGRTFPNHVCYRTGPPMSNDIWLQKTPRGTLLTKRLQSG